MKILPYLPGFLFCFAVSFVALLLSHYLPQVGHIALSLLLGVLFSNIFSVPGSFRLGTSFCEKRVLECSIALLGFNLSYHDLSFLNLGTILALVVMVVLVLLASIFAGRLLGFPRSLSFLIGVGSAVCGSAAIMATSRVLKSPRKDIILALAVTHFLGILALFTLPFLLQGYDKIFSAYMIGGSLQAMGHVVAATSLLDAQSANIAIAVKMVRILLLTPLVLGLSFFVAKKNKSEGSKVMIPLYIIFFAFFVFVGNFYSLPGEFLQSLKKLSHLLLSFAMAGLGSSIRAKDLSGGFGKYTSFAGVLFVCQLLFLFFVY